MIFNAREAEFEPETAVEAVGAAAVDVVKGRAVLLRWRTRSVSSSISRRLF